MSTTPTIVARNLGKRYRNTRALDGATFTVEPGRIVGLVGPNGAGKTTALKAVLGLIAVEGELSVLGQSPRAQRNHLMNDVCFIADVAILPRWIRVRQVMDFVEAVHPRFDRERCMGFLHGTRLSPDLRVRQMSKGMIVQLHLALVMAINARLLVLDEPTLGLDILHRKQFYQRLVEDYFDADKTILITTHQVEEVEHILTDVLFIRDGRIVLDVPMDALGGRFVELLTDAAHVEAARALGPIHVRALPFGKSVLLFDGVPRADLSAFGETRIPGLADVFVATLSPSGANP